VFFFELESGAKHTHSSASGRVGIKPSFHGIACTFDIDAHKHAGVAIGDTIGNMLVCSKLRHCHSLFHSR
jgi:hypothetical protein